MQTESQKQNERQKREKCPFMKFMLSKDSAMVHVTCAMCYTGIELQSAQEVLRYLLARISSAHGSQSVVHIGHR